MKILLNLIILTCLTIKPDIYKQYVGGRTFYSSIDLTLYNNGKYQLTEFYKPGGYTKDSGEYIIEDSIIMLNSLQSISETKNYLTKKQQRKLKSDLRYTIAYDSSLIHIKDSFVIRNDLILFFKQKETQDSISDFEKTYLTLKEIPSNED